jgi:hypothetical protein
MKEILSEEIQDNNGGYAPVGCLVRLCGTIAPARSPGEKVAGTISLRWSGSLTHKKEYGETAPVALASGTVLTVHIQNALPEKSRTVTWSDIEHEDFAKALADEAPGPHVKVRVTSRMLAAGECIALIARVRELRFKGEGQELRENSSQEPSVVDAILLAVGDDAKEQLQNKIEDIKRRDQTAKQWKQRMVVLGEYLLGFLNAMKNPAVFVGRNIVSIVFGLMALVGVILGVRAFFLFSYFLDFNFYWALLLCNIAVFGWYLGLVSLPRFVEDGDELVLFEAKGLRDRLSNAGYRQSEPKSIKQLKEAGAQSALPGGSGNTDWTSTIIAWIFLGGFCMALFLVGSSEFHRSVVYSVVGVYFQERIRDALSMQSFALMLLLFLFILWIVIGNYSRVKFARILLRAKPAKSDGSWGFVEGVAQNSTDETLELRRGEALLKVNFAGAFWADPKRQSSQNLYDALRQDGREVLLVGRVRADGVSAKGRESLFLFVSEKGSARKAVAYSLRCFWMALGFFVVSFIVSAIMFAFIVPPLTK